MNARWDRVRAARADQTLEQGFCEEFARVCDETLRPVAEEIVAELRRAGHDARVEVAPPGEPPRFDVFLLILGRTGSKDLIRLEPRTDRIRGDEVVAELFLKQSPVELTRFRRPSAITRDIAEQCLVDALEQVFFSPAG